MSILPKGPDLYREVNTITLQEAMQVASEGKGRVYWDTVQGIIRSYSDRKSSDIHRRDLKKLDVDDLVDLVDAYLRQNPHPTRTESAIAHRMLAQLQTRLSKKVRKHTGPVRHFFSCARNKLAGCGWQDTERRLEKLAALLELRTTGSSSSVSSLDLELGNETPESGRSSSEDMTDAPVIRAEGTQQQRIDDAVAILEHELGSDCVNPLFRLVFGNADILSFKADPSFRGKGEKYVLVMKSPLKLSAKPYRMAPALHVGTIPSEFEIYIEKPNKVSFGGEKGIEVSVKGFGDRSIRSISWEKGTDDFVIVRSGIDPDTGEPHAHKPKSMSRILDVFTSKGVTISPSS